MTKEWREATSLALRTINDTLRHVKLSNGCFEALEETARQLKELLKDDK